MGEFSAATTVVPREAAGEFDVDLDPRWAMGDKPNGGYLLAVLGRAAGLMSGHPDLTAISGLFVQPPKPGPAVVTVEVLRAGRGSTQLQARLTQDGLPRVEALITQGVLDDGDARWSGAVPVAPPPMAECPRSGPLVPGSDLRIHILDVVELRLDPAVLGFARNAPTGRGMFAGWLRLADGSDWSPLSLLVAVDSMPPIGYDLGVPGWAPTVQLSAYVRRPPAPGPIRIRTTGTDLGTGQVDQTVLAWDSADRLVVQSFQIRAVRLPS